MRVGIFGAAPDTPNMGVSALFTSAVNGLAKHFTELEVVVFDNGLGRRDGELTLHDGRVLTLIRYGARHGRRYNRPENIATQAFASRLGRVGAMLNEGIRLIDSCAAIFDISGGDSFSDIYGRERFDKVNRPKQIAINRRIPLILLPQTFGPYKDPTVLALATDSVCKASMAWARDQDSYAALQSLTGDSFDPEKHRCGVDMAFGLQPSDASHLVDSRLNAWIGDRERSQAVIGFNVSGLIYNDRVGAVSRYGLKADYRETVVNFLKKLLLEHCVRIVLIPHVMDRAGHHESDWAACVDVLEQLGDQAAERVAIAPATLNESQVKWLIAQMDWFCGTRMHSTIAALSSGVATAAISYSDKTKGVFQTCGQEMHVMDPRTSATEEIVRNLAASFGVLEATRISLKAQLPAVKDMAAHQMQTIAAFLEARHGVCPR